MVVIAVRIEEDKYGESFMQNFGNPSELHDKTRYQSPEGTIYSIKSIAVAGSVSQENSDSRIRKLI